MEDQDKNNLNVQIPPEEELAKCKRERDEYLAGWQRAKADFVNYKKEELRRIEDLGRYQNEDIIRDLITVLDNFDLTLVVLGKDKEAPTLRPESSEVGVPTPKAVGIEKGIYMIRTQIEDILRQRGLEKIMIRAGDPYDPNVAEAIAEGESKDLSPGSVMEVIETGYKLSSKVIRPARVKIVKQ